MNNSIVDSWSSVTVWTADGQLHSRADYGAGIIARFKDLGLTVTSRSLETITGEESLDGSDVHVLSGGSTSVNDTSTWMPAAFRLVDRMIHAARDESIHLMGICLGSQIIAHRLTTAADEIGGERGEEQGQDLDYVLDRRHVIVSGDQMYAGLVDCHWWGLSGQHAQQQALYSSASGGGEYGSTDDDDTTGSDSSNVPVATTVLPSFHFEMINPTVLTKTTAPLEIVCSNDSVSVLAYTSGPRIGATQLHPELTVNDVNAFIDFNAEIIHANGSSAEQAREWTDERAERWNENAFEDVLNRLFKQSQ